MRRIGALSLVLLVAACASAGEVSEPSSQPPSISPSATPAESSSEGATTVAIEVLAKLGISEANAIVGDDTCLPQGDYGSFDDPNLQGVVKDAEGATIGIGEFGAIEVLEGGCLRTFTVEVPAGAEFYSLEVREWASNTYSEADAETNGISLVVDAP